MAKGIRARELKGKQKGGRVRISECLYVPRSSVGLSGSLGAAGLATVAGFMMMCLAVEVQKCVGEFWASN